MNSPRTTPRLLLVADPRAEAADAGGPAVRRFRIARVRYDARGLESGSSAARRTSARS